eukprot:Cvel_17215.t1-p1 / transcript=Cvel_17215.t1 / gene=Cvel_17215 / organism=Chromera_velia_CCMP2878 / gene_product=hypothetical protein / transcript_product=hypothetical protein / location=Cvel_scaffold1362:53-2264(-) / protein_length=115 / sequence_SO=supercontig / SO=protein_coding / is_pseudo=false
MEDDGDRIGDDFGGDQGHAEEEDLEGLRCVSLSEAFVIMEERQKVSPVAEKNAEMFRLYKKYTEEFQKFRNSMTLKQLRDRLVNYEISADGRKLNDYEAAMLMNLIPRTAQEAIV